MKVKCFVCDHRLCETRTIDGRPICTSCAQANFDEWAMKDEITQPMMQVATETAIEENADACPDCNGTGSDSLGACLTCIDIEDFIKALQDNPLSTCSKCHGKGRILDLGFPVKCTACDGKGMA